MSSIFKDKQEALHNIAINWYNVVREKEKTGELAPPFHLMMHFDL